MIKTKIVKQKDPTVELLRGIKKVNDRQMGASLPTRAFVDLQGFGYVTGSASATHITSEGMKAIESSGKGDGMK